MGGGRYGFRVGVAATLLCASVTAVTAATPMLAGHVAANPPHGAPITGTVTDAVTGAPIEGACLTSPITMWNGDTVPVLGCTDAAGQFLTSIVAEGYYDLLITPPDGSPYLAESLSGSHSSDNSVLAPVVSPTATVRNFQLDRGARITGTVTGDDSGAPLAGVHVQLDGADYTGVDTDANGHFAAGPIVPGDYTVTVVPTDGIHAPETYDNSPPADVTHITAVDGQDTDLTVAVPVGATVTGTVRDTSGNPLTSACVHVSDPPGGAIACTDTNGRYDLGGVAPGGVYLTVYKAGYIAQYDNQLTVTAPATAAPDITLTPLATVSGTVTDATHAPVSGGTVQLVSSPYPTGATSDVRADGTYTISEVPPGTAVTVLYEPPTGSPLAHTYFGGSYGYDGATVFDVGVGDTVSGIDITATTGGSISGRVTEQGGAPVLGATVTAVGPESLYTEHTAVTASDGTYTVIGLAPGRYNVRFTGPDSASPAFESRFFDLAVPVTAGVTTPGVDHVLQRRSRIEGRVTDAGLGVGVPGYVVAFSASGGQGGVGQIVDGVYRIDVDPGSYVVKAIPYGGFAPLYFPQQAVFADATTVTVAQGVVAGQIDFVVAQPVGEGFHALPQPVRLIDSRPGRLGVLEQPDGFIGEVAAPLAANQAQRFGVTNVAGIPADPVGLALTVTAVNPGANGYLTVYPCATAADPVPPTSTLNVRADITIANATILRPGAGGGVCVRSSVPTHVILDATGYFSRGFVGRTQPVRLLDTRFDHLGTTELPGGAIGHDVVTPLGSFDMVVVPIGPGVAATVNVTVVDPPTDGWISLERCGQIVIDSAGAPTPTATTGATTTSTTGTTAVAAGLAQTSTLNFAAGVTVANSLVVSSGGRLCVRSNTRVHLVIDLTGYFETGAAGSDRWRLLDTRPAQTGTLEATDGSIGHDVTAALVPGVPQRFELRGPQWHIPTDPAGYALNLTAVGATSAGYLTAYPCASLATPVPATSSLNFTAGMNQANAVYMDTDDATGGLCVVASKPVHLIIDGPGWFS